MGSNRTIQREKQAAAYSQTIQLRTGRTDIYTNAAHYDLRKERSHQC